MQDYGLPFVFGMFMVIPAAAKVMASGLDWVLSKTLLRKVKEKKGQLKVSKP